MLTVGMLVASLLEGAGLTMLMPLLGRIGLGDAASANVPILRIIDPLLLALGVPYEIGSLMAIVVGLLLLQVTATLAVKCFEAHCTKRYTAYWRNRLDRKSTRLNSSH